MRLEDIVDLRQEGFRRTSWIEINFDVDRPRVRPFQEKSESQEPFEESFEEEDLEPEPLRECEECSAALIGRQSLYCSKRCGNRHRQRDYRRWLRSLEKGSEDIIGQAVGESNLAEQAQRERERQARGKKEYLMATLRGREGTGYYGNAEAVECLHAEETRTRFWAKPKVSTATPKEDDATILRLSIVDEEGELIADYTPTADELALSASDLAHSVP